MVWESHWPGPLSSWDPLPFLFLERLTVPQGLNLEIGWGPFSLKLAWRLRAWQWEFPTIGSIAVWLAWKFHFHLKLSIPEGILKFSIIEPPLGTLRDARWDGSLSRHHSLGGSMCVAVAPEVLGDRRYSNLECETVVDFWWQYFCGFLPWKIGLEVVTKSFTTLFTTEEKKFVTWTSLWGHSRVEVCLNFVGRVWGALAHGDRDSLSGHNNANASRRVFWKQRTWTQALAPGPKGSL